MGKSDLLPAEWDYWTPEQKTAFISRIKYDWKLWARPEQYAPIDDLNFRVFLLLAGRGFGKSRTAAEWGKNRVLRFPGTRLAVVAPTFGAVRDVMLEGDSGLMSVLPPDTIEKYNRSLSQIHLKNGSMVLCYSSQDPERLRGPQHHWAICDELVAWQYQQDTWDMLQFGMRLGLNPQILISTTPKASPLIIELTELARHEPEHYRLVKGSTYDNAANLAPSALEALKRRYEGTALGRQELFAELLMDSEGALWTRGVIDKSRIGAWHKPDLGRIVVSVDPGVAPTGDRANETGIIVAGIDSNREGYVIADLSMRGASPEAWARRVNEAYLIHKADRVIYERNQGGDMVAHTLKTANPNLPLKGVVASRGKEARAEPISALYEQGRVHHIGNFPDLEDQMCQWVPGSKSRSSGSPDRMDALVWAMSELMRGGGIAEIYTPDPFASRIPRL